MSAAPRQDLLALSDHDLASLANRGLVRRARKDVERGELSVEFSTGEEGELIAAWSDEVTCRLPRGAALDQRLCSCPGTTVCRHLLRTVIAYQAEAERGGAPSGPGAGAPGEGGAIGAGPGNAALEAPPAGGESTPDSAEAAALRAVGVDWDPGAFGDAEVEALYSKRALTHLRKLAASDLTVELTGGAKPRAYFHELACTLRFLAPGNASLTHCDCAEQAPCAHVALAVWAFRRLPAGARGGLVSSAEQRALSQEDAELFADLEASVTALWDEGLSLSPQVPARRFAGLARACERAGWTWLTSVLDDLVACCERYRAGDARFDPLDLARHAAELLARLDAAASGVLPPVYVRGAATKARGKSGTSRLVGLGCEALPQRGRVELRTYLQDVGSGALVAVSETFPDPEEGEPSSFDELARRAALTDVSYRDLSARSLQLLGGKRGADQRLHVGRARRSLSAQSYAFEALREPFRHDRLSDLRERVSSAPPACLSPRRVTEGLIGCVVAGARDVRFEGHEQASVATLFDAAGDEAELRFPYWNRGAAGHERLLRELSAHGAELRFVCGRARASRGRVVVTPVSLVFERGETRRMVQPWVDAPSAFGSELAAHAGTSLTGVEGDPLGGSLPGACLALLERLGACFVSGGRSARSLRALDAEVRRAEALGLDRLPGLVRRLRADSEALGSGALGGALVPLLIAAGSVH